MAIFSGSSKIKEILSGSTPIKEVRSGSNIVYQSSLFNGLGIKDLCFLHVTANNSGEYWGICSEEWFDIMTSLSAYNFEFTSISCPYPEIEDDVYSLYAWRHPRKAINIPATPPSGHAFLVMAYQYGTPTASSIPSFGGTAITAKKMRKVTGSNPITLSIPSTTAQSSSAFVTAIFKVPTGYTAAPNISLGIAAKTTNNAAIVFNEFNESKIFTTPTYTNKLNLYITGPAETSNDQPVVFAFQDNVTTQTTQQDTIWEDPSTPMLVRAGGGSSGAPYIPYIGFSANSGPA